MAGVSLRINLLVTMIYLSATGSCSDTDTGKEEQVLFYHYPNTNSPQQILPNNIDSLKALKQGPIYLVIDGFLSSFETTMSQLVKDSLLKSRPNGNIIIVDWSKLSGSDILSLDENTQYAQLMMAYNVVKTKVGLVGKKVAKFLAQLSNHNITEFSKTHLIGYSLGAHIAGISGLHVIEKYDGRIQRITGLDPAGPGFPMEKARKRLDKSDAEFVDIYYTNRYTAGDIEHQVGHVDVYINGGKKQPGCAFPNILQTTICNHAFSWRAWNKCMTEKCKACPCEAQECQNCSGTCSNGIIVGMDMSMDINGDYYLKMEPLPMQ